MWHKKINNSKEYIIIIAFYSYILFYLLNKKGHILFNNKIVFFTLLA